MPATGKTKKKKIEGFSIEHEVLIKAQAKKVFRAISTTEGIKGWWTVECNLPEKEGEVAEFGFGSYGGNKMTIVKLEQNRLTSWKCFEGKEEWIDTVISMKLVPDGMATKLVFEHAGWKKKTDFFKLNTGRWAEFLQSLKSYCETGVGQPFHE